jgi:hypothetical protein
MVPRQQRNDLDLHGTEPQQVLVVLWRDGWEQSAARKAMKLDEID